MYRMRNNKIAEIMRKHRLWLENDPEGEKACFRQTNLSRANFNGANLRGVDFSGSILYNASFIGADLKYADFTKASMMYAKLERANLDYTILKGAKLSQAQISRASICFADISGAYLECSRLYGSDLSNAKLDGANLSNCDLRGAILYSASLIDSDLSHSLVTGANFLRSNCLRTNLFGVSLEYADFGAAFPHEAINVHYIPMACPDAGAFVAWKKVKVVMKKEKIVTHGIVKLLIPASAKRSSAVGRKCRANKAKVLSIEIIGGGRVDHAYSVHDSSFVYRVGQIVEVEDFDDNRFEECAPGIHFFINKQEAIDY